MLSVDSTTLAIIITSPPLSNILGPCHPPGIPCPSSANTVYLTHKVQSRLVAGLYERSKHGQHKGDYTVFAHVIKQASLGQHARAESRRNDESTRNIKLSNPKCPLPVDIFDTTTHLFLSYPDYDIACLPLFVSFTR